MVFCNKGHEKIINSNVNSHNPYFNRWFSAIKQFENKMQGAVCHNPYFNRWFSAINAGWSSSPRLVGHNPYFNRWFSAISYLQEMNGQ